MVKRGPRSSFWPHLSPHSTPSLNTSSPWNYEIFLVGSNTNYLGIPHHFDGATLIMNQTQLAFQLFACIFTSPLNCWFLEISKIFSFVLPPSFLHQNLLQKEFNKYLWIEWMKKMNEKKESALAKVRRHWAMRIMGIAVGGTGEILRRETRTWKWVQAQVEDRI